MSKKESDKKSESLRVRVSPNELKIIDEIAKNNGIKRSAYCREILMQSIRKSVFMTDGEKAIFAILHDDLRRIGVNLNQIARRLNSGKEIYQEALKIEVINSLIGVERITLELQEFKNRRYQKLKD